MDLSLAASVSVRLENLDDLFTGRPGDAREGRWPVRSGVDQLRDVVHPSTDPLRVELVLNEGGASSGSAGEPEAETSVRRALAGYATVEIQRIDAEVVRVRRLGRRELVFGLAFLAVCLVLSST